MRFVYWTPPLRALICRMFAVKNPSLEREFCGLKFSNPVGLAAGFDKNANLYRAFSMLGFSFIEIGTVTPRGQPGNPKPRLFRITQDGALINRMGFNNKGVAAAVEQLKRKRPDVVIGGNIGKNTATPNENAADDYLECFRKLYPYVDYFTLNVSCPNVANLSELQNINSLEAILKAVITVRNRLSIVDCQLSIDNRQSTIKKPVLLKISPDISFEHLNDILLVVEKMGVDGIVAVNTTKRDRGGLSGQPLTQKALETVSHIRRQTNGKLPIIGVGGIMTADDAVNMLNAGATLIQIYTGFIYDGPGLIKKINKAIV